ncbi:MAG: FAD:protein FMN transferase [Clostridia bacterium]|nr:FAD:protein FMN transferase [Clostridia bacterium]
MEMRRRAVILLALAMAITWIPAAAVCEEQTSVGFYFDTVVTVRLYDPDSRLMEDIMAACGRYENLLSKTVAGSDVDRINTAGGRPVTVDHETWEILTRAKEISERSGGAFSVTVAPLTAMWDFTEGTQRMPSDAERLVALPLVDDTAIVLGPDDTVTLPEHMQIDLGGIAKGYIADRIADLVRGRCAAALLNFGGNVYCVGIKPNGQRFKVGIRDPQGTPDSVFGAVSVADVSVVTSGVYERFFIKDGVRYHHILNPATGLPAWTDLAGVTVVDQSSMTADAAATACIVLGSEGALAFLTELGLDGLLVTNEGQILATPGFADKWVQ